jgi:hypothetical protein
MAATKDRPSRQAVRDDIPPLPTVPLRDDMVLNYADAAAYLRITPEQVERWVNLGCLGSKKLNERCVRILGRQLREFIEAAEERALDPDARLRGRPKVMTRHAKTK